jgi:hypothetical protein
MHNKVAGLSGYILAASVSVSVVVASSADAQDVRELGRRLDSIALLAAEARNELNAYDRARPVAPKRWTDSVVIAGGKVTVYSNRDVAPLAKVAASRADSIFRQLGGATATFPSLMFSVRRDTTRGLDRRLSIIVSYHPAPGGSINSGAPEDAKAIAKVIVDQATGVVLDRSQSPFSKWLRRSPVPLDPHDIAIEPDWGSVRLDLISSPSLLGKGCYGGDADACAMYLGLQSVADPVMAWYDSLARYNQVKVNSDWAFRNQSGATTRCLEGSDKDCGTALRAMGHYVDPPGNAFARAAIMRQAIALGGDRAAERLLTSTGSASDALAAAANAPIDSVIRAWQRNVRERAISSRDLSLRLSLVAIGWIAVLGFVALRSSRWR